MWWQSDIARGAPSGASQEGPQGMIYLCRSSSASSNFPTDCNVTARFSAAVVVFEDSSPWTEFKQCNERQWSADFTTSLKIATTAKDRVRVKFPNSGSRFLKCSRFSISILSNVILHCTIYFSLLQRSYAVQTARPSLNSFNNKNDAKRPSNLIYWGSRCSSGFIGQKLVTNLWQFQIM